MKPSLYLKKRSLREDLIAFISGSIILLSLALAACGSNNDHPLDQRPNSNLQPQPQPQSQPQHLSLISPILITPAQARIKPGGFQLFTAYSAVKAIQPGAFQWSSDNQTVASVEIDGLVKANMPGTVTVTATIQGVSQTATLEVDPSAPRPVELIELTPQEESTVQLAHCEENSVCRLSPTIHSVIGKFLFPEGEFFDSARLLVDGADMNSQAKVVSDVSAGPNRQGELTWDQVFGLPAGVHRADIEAKSRTGRTVAYRWIFSVSRQSGIQGVISAGPLCPVVTDTTAFKCAVEPALQATVVVADGNGKEVTRFSSDSQGEFTVALSPGTYILEPIPLADHPSAKPKTIVVSQDQMSVLSLGYDTGIR